MKPPSKKDLEAAKESGLLYVKSHVYVRILKERIEARMAAGLRLGLPAKEIVEAVRTIIRESA